MPTIHSTQPIQCGNHELKAHITIINYKHERNIDGHAMQFREPPTITIQCETCGRETTTNSFSIDETVVERTWSL